MNENIENVLSFWLYELSPRDWYLPAEGLDAEIAGRFSALWERAMAGECRDWPRQAGGALALLILTDQMPRNMFRDEARAFASDPLARAVAQSAIWRGLPARIEGLARQFFFMPLMHSESLQDQEQGVRHFLFERGRMESAAGQLRHARAHREVIRRYGRFPTRNAALGRVSSPAEQAYLAQGYGALVEEMRGD